MASLHSASGHYLLLAVIVVVAVMISSSGSMVEGWFSSFVDRKEYWISNAISTIQMTASSQVDVVEDIVFGFSGSFGRVERAICHDNLPFYALSFIVADLVVFSNYSQVDKVESDLSKKRSCYSIHAYLKERTPKDQETYVKFTFKYSMKGPLAGKGGEFNFGWNMKFKKGFVNTATFRVDYPSELYFMRDSSPIDIGNGMKRIEKHFRSLSPKSNMELNLKGIIKSKIVELIPPPLFPPFLIALVLMVIIVFVCLCVSQKKEKVDEEYTNTNGTSTIYNYDYDSDSGFSSGGCDAD